jgi:hypothetical protein
MNRKQFEQTKIHERLTEVMILFIFILGAFAASVLVMNLLVFPVTLFAVKENIIFISLVKKIIIIGIITYLTSRIAHRISISRKSGISVPRALFASMLRRGKNLAYALGITVLSIFIFVLLYVLLSSNSELLYRLAK